MRLPIQSLRVSITQHYCVILSNDCVMFVRDRLTSQYDKKARSTVLQQGDQSCQVQKMKNLEVITAINPYLSPVSEMDRVNNADNQMVSQCYACDGKKMSLRAQNT